MAIKALLNSKAVTGQFAKAGEKNDRYSENDFFMGE